MLSKDDLGRLLAYTVWANHRVLRPVATLSLDEYRRDLGASHGGVRGTLTHMMGAEWIWLERFKGVSPTRPLDEADFSDVVALRDHWKMIEGHRDAWWAGVKRADVAAPIRYRSLAGQEFENPLWQLIQHVANHSTYHRGQVVAMLRQLKARVASTDMIVWDRQRSAPRD